MFDAEEYLHLALHASSKGDFHACIGYLKELLWHEPKNTAALYLLAVQHAEIGLSDRAIKGMKAALGIDPGMDVVRFQLGLLLMDQGRKLEASEQFSLLSFAADRNLRSFSGAMAALLDDDSLRAREQLTLGLREAPPNQPLNSVMKRILEALTRGEKPRPWSPLSLNVEMRLGAYRYAIV